MGIFSPIYAGLGWSHIIKGITGIAIGGIMLVAGLFLALATKSPLFLVISGIGAILVLLNIFNLISGRQLLGRA